MQTRTGWRLSSLASDVTPDPSLSCRWANPYLLLSNRRAVFPSMALARLRNFQFPRHLASQQYSNAPHHPTTFLAFSSFPSTLFAAHPHILLFSGHGKTIRIASKSVRAPALIARALNRQPDVFQGRSWNLYPVFPTCYPCWLLAEPQTSNVTPRHVAAADPFLLQASCATAHERHYSCTISCRRLAPRATTFSWPIRYRRLSHPLYPHLAASFRFWRAADVTLHTLP